MFGNRWMRRGGALLAAGGLCLSLAVGISQATAPQGEGKRPAAARRQHGGRMMAVLEKLNLSEAQKTQLRAIQARQREEMRALRPNGAGGDRQAMRSRMREVRAKYRAEFMGVLTPAQQNQLKEEMKKVRAGRKAAGRAKA